MTNTECTHPRQDRLSDTDEWACKDCGAQMDPTDPNRRLS